MYLCIAALFDGVSYIVVLVEVHDRSFSNWLMKLNECSYVLRKNTSDTHIEMKYVRHFY